MSVETIVLMLEAKAETYESRAERADNIAQHEPSEMHLNYLGKKEVYETVAKELREIATAWRR